MSPPRRGVHRARCGTGLVGMRFFLSQRQPEGSTYFSAFGSSVSAAVLLISEGLCFGVSRVAWMHIRRQCRFARHLPKKVSVHQPGDIPIQRLEGASPGTPLYLSSLSVLNNTCTQNSLLSSSNQFQNRPSLLSTSRACNLNPHVSYGSAATSRY